MKVYQLSFDYDFAYADVVESLNGADSLDLSNQTPEMFSDFKYGWITDESKIIPELAIIISEILVCKVDATHLINCLPQNVSLHNILIGEDSYMAFANLPNISECVNKRKSKITRFSTGDIMEITNPVFFPIDYPLLFTVEDIPSKIFCNEDFKNIIDSNNLTGLNFKECPIKSNIWF